MDPYAVADGQGGNDFRQVMRELSAQSTMFLCVVNWYSYVDPKPFFTEPGDHGGELETSIMMQVKPELVRPLSEAGTGHAQRFRLRVYVTAGRGCRARGRR